MNSGPVPPQLPNPNQRPTPPAGFEPPVAEAGNAHLLQQHGTEMVQPRGPERPSHEEMARAAIAKLTMGESVVVHLPEGNTKVTYRGVGADGKPIYQETLLPRSGQATQPPEQAAKPVEDQSTRPALQPLQRPVNPYTPDVQTPLPPSVYGPQGGFDFGPTGSPEQYQTPQRSFVTPPRGSSRPPEAYPDAGPDIEARTEVPGDDLYYDPRTWGKPENEAVEGDPAVPLREQVVEEETPAVEKVRPETVQTDSDGMTVEAEKDLADQLADGTAPPVAEMPDEHREDMTAVRRPGAKAAAEKAEATKLPEDQETPAIEGIGGNTVPDNNEEGDITQVLPEGVVPEGKRPPDTDFTPGGGLSRLYRR